MQNSIVLNCTTRYCNKFETRRSRGGAIFLMGRKGQKGQKGRVGQAGRVGRGRTGEAASNQQPAASGQWEAGERGGGEAGAEARWPEGTASVRQQGGRGQKGRKGRVGRGGRGKQPAANSQRTADSGQWTVDSGQGEAGGEELRAVQSWRLAASCSREPSLKRRIYSGE